MRLVLLGGIAILAASVVYGENVEGPKWVTAPVSERSYLSLTFDDATASQFTAAFPILERRNLSATLYVNTGPLDTADPLYMSWEHVRTMHQAGWEIGGHTVSHPLLPELSDAEIVGELAFSNRRIAEEIGGVPTSFASPFDAYDERVLAHIKGFYPLHVRGWGEDGGINDTSDFDPLFLKRVNVDGTLTAAEICRKVRSVRNGEWLILMFHQVAIPDGPYISSPAQLEAITDCVVDSAQNSNLIVGTVSAVYNNIKKE